MNIILTGIVALLTGVATSLGLGGGMILMVYLTAFAGVSQLSAQGINLLFFIPIATLALILHSRKKLVAWKKIAPSILFGIVGAFLGATLAAQLDGEILRKGFAIFTLIVGAREVFSRSRSRENEDTPPK